MIADIVCIVFIIQFLSENLSVLDECTGSMICESLSEATKMSSLYLPCVSVVD